MIIRLLFSALLLSLVPMQPASAGPANDNFADATLISELPFESRMDTQGVTDEEFEGTLETGCPANAGVWFRFEPANDVETITVMDMRSVPVASIYEGADPSNLRFIACHRGLDGKPGSSDGNLQVFEGGHTYHLRLATNADTHPADEFILWLDVAHGISGDIRDGAGRPVGGALVWAWRAPDWYMEVAAACSRSDGTFRVSGVPAMWTYSLQITAGACDPGEDEAPRSSVPKGTKEWYEDALTERDARILEVDAKRDSDIHIDLGPRVAPSSSTPPDETSEPTPEPSARDDDTEATASISPSPSEPAGVHARAVADRGTSGGQRVVGTVAALVLGVALTLAWQIRRRAKRQQSA